MCSGASICDLPGFIKRFAVKDRRQAPVTPVTNAPFHVPESRSPLRESQAKKPRKSAIVLIKQRIYEVS